jgi:hypothetical protein
MWKLLLSVHFPSANAVVLTSTIHKTCHTDQCCCKVGYIVTDILTYDGDAPIHSWRACGARDMRELLMGFHLHVPSQASHGVEWVFCNNAVTDTAIVQEAIVCHITRVTTHAHSQPPT